MALLSLEKKVALAMGIPVFLGILMTWSASIYNTYTTNINNDTHLRAILQEQVLIEFSHQIKQVELASTKVISTVREHDHAFDTEEARSALFEALLTTSQKAPEMPLLGFSDMDGNFFGLIHKEGRRRYFTQIAETCQYRTFDSDDQLDEVAHEAACRVDWKAVLARVSKEPTGKDIHLINLNGHIETTLAIALTNPRGQWRGIVVGGINVEEIDRVVERSKLPAGGRALLMNGNGEPVIFAHIPHDADDRSDKVYVSTLAQAINGLMESSSTLPAGQSKEFHFDGHRYTIDINVLSFLGHDNWKMAVLTAERGWRHFDTPTTRLTLLFFGMGLLLAFWLGLRLARNISRPIALLDQASKAIAEDRFEPTMLQGITRRHDEIGRLAQNFQNMMEIIHNREEHLNQLVQKKTVELQKKASELEVKNTENESLLLNILPPMIAKRLKAGEETLVNTLPEATIIFCDLVGFTKLSAKLDSRKLVAMLNTLFSEFDKMTLLHGVEKIKTIGDAYMAVAGLPEPVSDHAVRSIELVMSWMKVLENFNAEMNIDLKMRVGINTGPVVAGVIGTHKFIYDLWGDAVNTASRMESHGIPNRIQVSESTYKKLSRLYNFEDRGEIEVKGKGRMRVFLLIDRKKNTRPIVQWVTRSDGHHDIVIGDGSKDGDDEMDWMALLNAPVNADTIHALLTKRIGGRRQATPHGLADKIEPPVDVSWDELLKSEVSLKNIKTLLTKDIFSSSSTMMAARTSSKKTHDDDARDLAEAPLMKSTASSDHSSFGREEVEEMVANIEAEITGQPLDHDDELTSTAAPLNAADEGAEMNDDAHDIDIDIEVEHAIEAPPDDAPFAQAHQEDPHAHAAHLQSELDAPSSPNVEDQIHQLLLNYLDKEDDA